MESVYIDMKKMDQCKVTEIDKISVIFFKILQNKKYNTI